MVKTPFQGVSKMGIENLSGLRNIPKFGLTIYSSDRVLGEGSGTFSKWNEKGGNASFDKSEEIMLT